MNKKIKKIMASVMTAIIFTTGITSISANAGSVSWNSPYGTVSGSSTTSIWSTTGTPVFRKVTARTGVTNAVPNIYARIEGYVNNSLVMSANNTLTDNTVAVAEAMNQNYAYSSVTGNGTHAIWSSTLTRVNHYSYF